MRVRVHHTAHHLTKFKFDCHAPCASSVVPGSNPALRALSQIRCSVFDASRLKLRRFRCWYRVDFLFILLLLLFHANRQRIPRQNKTLNKYVNRYNWLAITIIHDIGDAFCAPLVSISIKLLLRETGWRKTVLMRSHDQTQLATTEKRKIANRLRVRQAWRILLPWRNTGTHTYSGADKWMQDLRQVFWQCKIRTESLQFNDPAAAVLCSAYYIDNLITDADFLSTH